MVRSHWQSLLINLIVATAASASTLVVAAETVSADSVSQFGITWHFAEPRPVSRFVNGDFGVLGPVTIVSITPASTTIDGRTLNGAMLNPTPGYVQGYDSQVVGYDPTLNVAQQLPLTITAGSLVCTISVAANSAVPQLRTCSILTVLKEVPPSDAFRPPYCGTDKTIRHRWSEIQPVSLPSLAPVASAPTFTDAASWFERPWLDHVKGWEGRELHPADNMPDYGREIATQAGRGALCLCLAAEKGEKDALLIRFLQLGVDLTGIALNGGGWPCDGGHASGRKLPILFAGLVFNDPGMLHIGQMSGDYLYSDGYGPGNRPPGYIHFGEDDQTFYVTADDIYPEPYEKHIKGDFVYYGHGDPSKSWDAEEYTAKDLGLPEWGIRHATDRNRDGLDWDAPYRFNQTGGCWGGYVLVARLLGLQGYWNHDALFDYVDRYVANMEGQGYQFPGSFEKEMWAAYRNTDPVEPNEPPIIEPNEPTVTLVTLVPKFRFYHAKTGAHFWTVSESEKQKLITQFADVWIYEGIVEPALPPGYVGWQIQITPPEVSP